MNAPGDLEVQILNQVGGLLQLDVLPPSRQVAREPRHVPRHVHGVWVGNSARVNLTIPVKAAKISKTDMYK